MSRWWIPLTLASSLAIGLSIAGPRLDASAQPESTPAEDSAVARGRYLVHDVAMCVQCHSPRASDGTLAPDKLLHGAPIPVDGPPWVGERSYDAPDIVNLSRGRPDYVIEVLTTGKRPDDTVPKWPMPSYRLTDDDARAVVRYLTTLR